LDKRLNDVPEFRFNYGSKNLKEYVIHDYVINFYNVVGGKYSKYSH